MNITFLGARFAAFWSQETDGVSYLFFISQSILKKNVTMMHTPSAVYHFSDAAGERVSSNKVNAIFQAAKKDLLQVIQLQVKLPSLIFP